MRASRAVPILVFLLIAMGGCASSGSSGGSGDRNVITTERLADFRHLTALEAVQRIKPNWLRTTRGQDSFQAQGARGLRIYLDGVFYGEVDTLRSIPVAQVQEIRFLDKRQATLRFGTNHAEGAILVTTHGS